MSNSMKSRQDTDADRMFALSGDINPLGVMFPTAVAKALKSGFQEFFSPFGIGGLAKLTDEGLEILAIASDDPGNGNFTRFMDVVESKFNLVRFWDVLNPVLLTTLMRRCYTLQTLPDEHGVNNRCMTLLFALNRRRHHALTNPSLQPPVGCRSEDPMAAGRPAPVELARV